MQTLWPRPRVRSAKRTIRGHLLTSWPLCRYCAGGSLWDAMRRVAAKGSWSWDSRLQVLRRTSQLPLLLLPFFNRVLQILADVAQGLMHMHELDPPLIHRDVKSPNILLTASLPDARAHAPLAAQDLRRHPLRRAHAHDVRRVTCDA